MNEQNDSGNEIANATAKGGSNEKWFQKRINIVFAIFIILLWVFLWGMQLVATHSAKTALHESRLENAQSLAASIALFSRDMIVDEDYEALQKAADKLVEERPVAYVSFSDASDKIVVHTNRRYLDKDKSDMDDLPNVVSAESEVVVSKSTVGTIVVGIATKQ